MVKRVSYLFTVLLVLLLAAAPGTGQDLLEQTTLHTLDNGLRVIFVEQPYAPIIHFNLMFNVGGVDEEPGLGGIAHMVEHMAFKGTESIGSLDPDLELRLLQELEERMDALEAADAADDEEARSQAQQGVTALREELQDLAVPDVIWQLFDQHGGTGLNAYTGYDKTAYFISLPSNRRELWYRVYGDMMTNAVFRYFYEEVDVVKEERRQRNEDDPTGFLLEHFLRTAFSEHPYGRPLIGSMEEIAGYRLDPAKEFWNEHYHPNRAVLVLVGDVNPTVDLPLIQTYFGHWESGPITEWNIPEEPRQTEQRRVSVVYDAQPQLLVGFRKPTYPQRDAYVLDVIASLLSVGRTSRLHERLINEEQMVQSLSASANYPGIRYDNMLVFLIWPLNPHSPEAVEPIVFEEIARLQQEPVDPWELEKVLNQVQASFIRNLASGSGLADQLATYELFLGGHQNLLEYQNIIASITAEEIQDVARRYLTVENSVVGILETKSVQGGEVQ